MISQLIYTSDAAEGLTDADLGCILATSQRNNAEMGLTGMLLYGRGRFIQVLEGPPDVLGRMMARIAADERSTHVHTLLTRTIEARDFADWSMGFHRLTDADWVSHPAVNHFFDQPLDVSHFNAYGSPARFMLQAFRDLTAP